MGLLFRIPCAQRRDENANRVGRHRKPALESLEGRTLLSICAGVNSPMPQLPIASLAALDVEGPEPTPVTSTPSRLRTAVAD